MEDIPNLFLNLLRDVKMKKILIENYDNINQIIVSIFDNFVEDDKYNHRINMILKYFNEKKQDKLIDEAFYTLIIMICNGEQFKKTTLDNMSKIILDTLNF